MDNVRIFDGHNDAVQFMLDYRPDGRDFLVRSETGHLDLPRALEGGLAGGLFAMYAAPGQEPVDDLTITHDGYEVRYAEALHPDHARRQIDGQLSAIKKLIGRSGDKIRLATSVSEIEAARHAGVFAVVNTQYRYALEDLAVFVFGEVHRPLAFGAPDNVPAGRIARSASIGVRPPKIA